MSFTYQELEKIGKLIYFYPELACKEKQCLGNESQCMALPSGYDVEHCFCVFPRYGSNCEIYDDFGGSDFRHHNHMKRDLSLVKEEEDVLELKSSRSLTKQDYETELDLFFFYPIIIAVLAVSVIYRFFKTK